MKTRPVSLQELRDLGIEIHGEGVVMKPIRVEEAQDFLAFIAYDPAHHSQRGDTTALEYSDLESVVETLKQPYDPYLLSFGIWAGDTMVGCIDLVPPAGVDNAQVGYMVGKQYTGQGYAARALGPVTDFAFDRLGYKKIEAVIDSRNTASRRTLEKCGYEIDLISEASAESADGPAEVYLHYAKVRSY